MTRRSFWQAAMAAALLTASCGTSFAQQGGGGGRGGFGGGFGFFGGGGGSMPSIFLVMMPEVQKELKLDQAQIDLIQGMQQAGRGQRGNFNFQEFQSLSPEEQQKRRDAMRAEREKQTAEQDKQIADVLDAKQNARLKQLKIQRAGTRALAQKDVQDSLKLTADQKQKIADATKGEQDATRALFQNSPRPEPGQQPSQEQIQQFQQMQKKMTDLRASTDTKITAVLTDPQKKQFETMKGAPFTFPQPQFGGFGRRPGGGNN